MDNVDSARAVDDDIWRLFDLAEEYHAMGVLANRDGSWEEAQYYFEKSLRILAKLDIEGDSVLSPEAVKYSSLIDNVVADYRVALRSLGQLSDETTPTVLVERFGELEEKLGQDTLVIEKTEPQEIVYDLPVVMNDRVKSSIIYYQTVGKEVFTKFLVRSKRYERLFKDILDEYGLPHDLVYLSMVESGYNPNAYSWARAVGLWQFISSTGRLYGLKRNWWMDERRDPVKSTHAAARFLKDLYEKFGNWELAMAAYNGGPGRVSKTIKRQKTIDFWKMRLRRQTMDYVPLIYAATIIAKDPERYGFHDIDTEPEIVWENVEVDRCLDLKVVAREIGCSFKELKALNPELLRNYTPPNTKKYSLKIPLGAKDKFLAAYDDMPSPKETSWVKHRIRRGETVSTIAAKYGVSQYAVLEANNLKRRSRIYAGRTLIVPVPLDRSYNGKSKRTYAADGNTYKVRGGDTLWDIARAFGTSVAAIRRINYIERGSRIYVGQKLRIPSSAKNLKSTKSTPRYASRSSDGSSKAAGSKGSSGTVKTYTVRPGDTLWEIARTFGMTTSRLRSVNGLGRSSRIYPGQILKVQAGNGEYVVHKVKRGESLSRIARKYRTTIARILAHNDLIDPDDIKIGDKLKIYVR
ncbi:MAG: LysM peptidoglycan-binding domain-containing protein [Candidatus Zixiibacteriota bacterium]|nr:MAG: LysM peptidoglycan-binding domain-containing protein [candidate division Zixibacteria bacterium]